MAFTFASFEGKPSDKQVENMNRLWESTAKKTIDYPWRGSDDTIFLKVDGREHNDSEFWVEITQPEKGVFRVEFREPAA